MYYDFYVFGPIWGLLFMFILWSFSDSKWIDKDTKTGIGVCSCVVFFLGCIMFSTNWESEHILQHDTVVLPEGELHITRRGEMEQDLWDFWYDSRNSEFKFVDDITVHPRYTTLALNLNENVTSIHVIASSLSKTGRSAKVNKQVLRPSDGIVALPEADEVMVVFITNDYSRSQSFYRSIL